MRKISFVSAGCLVALALVPAGAAPFALTSPIVAAEILPAPPAAGSPAEKADLAEVARVQTLAGAGRQAVAAADGKTKSVAAFAGVIGPGFDLAKLPATAKLFDDIRDTEVAIVDSGKGYFKRPRPWVVDAALKPCSRNDEPLTSYPSGHTTMAYSMGVVLARLVPQKAAAILDRAADYAENRVICAVHYRSDIIAGQALGTAIAVRLFADPLFEQEFSAAKAELVAARLSTEGY